MPPAEFEPAIPAGERLQTHALDRSATGIGTYINVIFVTLEVTPSAYPVDRTQS